jgi:hypothetical protein
MYINNIEYNSNWNIITKICELCLNPDSKSIKVIKFNIEEVFNKYKNII